MFHFLSTFRYCRSYAEGNHRSCPIHHQDQDHRSPRKEILRLDRWIHLGFPVHLPTDVDLQARIRRIRPWNRPPQVLLSAYSIIIYHQLLANCNAPALRTTPTKAASAITNKDIQGNGRSRINRLRPSFTVLFTRQFYSCCYHGCTAKWETLIVIIYIT